MMPTTRRSFIARAAAALTVPLWPRVSALSFQARDAVRIKARPFELKQVRLRRGPFLDAAEINRKYMASLNQDSLLHMFRVTAGFPSSAKPLGGWEQPENELRGHFTGHYLSACALMSASLGDESFKARGNQLVAELAKCQKALGNGYLSAFPETFFDRLRAGTNVWAPFYTLHKIMVGLLDMHTYCDNAQALDVLKGMANWTRRWVDPLGEGHMARVLEREYGGMNDVLYNLFAVTGDRGYRQLAARFDHERIFAPLAEGRDELKGLHVNTQIPKIIGAARRYELTGDSRFREIADYFWREVTGKRCYCTGGTSNGEGWKSDPGKLAGELSGYTQECCCTYNMLKLTRHVFGWTADPGAADYYERALFNGILGTQHPDDGMTLYYVSLASGYWKLFGLPLDAFWCCTGSGVESFAKLGDSIYFHDDDGVYVNLFIASEVEWPEKGVGIIQETTFPETDTTTLRLRCKAPVRMPLRIRVPYWATRGGTVKVNGRELESFAEPSSYFVLNRTWQDGDKVEITMPMSLHVHSMPDDPTLQAVMYGPLVLTGRLGTEGLTKEILRAEPTKLRQVPEYKGKPVTAPEFKTKSQDPRDWIEPVPGRSLEFRTVGQAQNVALVPFYKLLDERYGVYWKVARA
ncbi:MAG TPA: beta-L-arabinofuranosidase domain-containing protein [Blastocatellia bacterium]|nr:beta-L-arabinofuranosidase domain-containing protein [Blastocatellia bacterium]